MNEIIVEVITSDVQNPTTHVMNCWHRVFSEETFDARFNVAPKLLDGKICRLFKEWCTIDDAMRWDFLHDENMRVLNTCRKQS